MILSIEQVFKKMERQAAELTAEEIADLFKRHHLRPIQGAIFGEFAPGGLFDECCGLGAILVDILEDADEEIVREVKVELPDLIHIKRATDAFVAGFDQEFWGDPSTMEMYEKGREAYRRVAAQQEASC